MKTLADRLAETRGHPSGFDYMRVGLALSILALHAVLAAHGSEAYKTAEGSIVHNYVEPALVPSFFALSGFLVAGSYERSETIFDFVGLRVLRIFPAVIVQTILAAFIVGAVFTAYSLSDYFSDRSFWTYLANGIGFYAQADLPGVFPSNPNPGNISGQLWTVPYELLSYCILVAVAVFGKSALRRNATAAVIGILIFYFVLQIARKHSLDLLPSHYNLIAIFLLGTIFFLHRHVIPWNSALAALGVVLYLLAETRQSFWVPLGWIGLVYAVLFLGHCNPRKLWPLNTGDYSYGIYVFHYAVLQSVAAIIGVGVQTWTILLFGLPLAGFVAALSWHLVEKPSIAARRRLPEFESALFSSLKHRWRRRRHPPLTPGRPGADEHTLHKHPVIAPRRTALVRTTDDQARNSGPLFVTQNKSIHDTQD
jgi:peptidoglycan/LPS O-acetylase OafA/YrhL